LKKNTLQKKQLMSSNFIQRKSNDLKC